VFFQFPAELPEQQGVEQDHTEEGSIVTERIASDLKGLVEEDYIVTEQVSYF
jgi:hypothetical protein